MSKSVFLLERSKVDIDVIRKFCDQKLSEDVRIDYKQDFPEEFERTICAFANTAGGIVLVGIAADKKTNKPIGIPGIELKKGLEERVIDICLSKISPPINPEVKICDFRSEPNKSESDRAVLFIRVMPSYRAPHYLLRTNEILVRVHNENRLAELPKIEHLIELREEFKSSSAARAANTYDFKHIITAEDIFETVQIVPEFPPESIISLDRENIDWLSKTMRDVEQFNQEPKPAPRHLTLEDWNNSGQIRRFCRIDTDGRIAIQRRPNVDQNKLYVYDSLSMLVRVLKATQEIYSRLGFFGGFSIGLTLINTKNLILELDGARRLLDRFQCEDTRISIVKTLRYDELTAPENVLGDVLTELCLSFRLALKKSDKSEIVKEILKRAL